ncbi:MAG: hypothetical protein ACYDD6_02425 [Acidimicrobiales bacterium]
MTAVALLSPKGSPGVTTLACLLGAVWPTDREVVVAECDPSGGDIAARFGLSTEVGMTSFVVARRQTGSSEEPLHHQPEWFPTEHVQSLPGGLHVLVGPVGGDAAFALDREIGVLAADSFAPGSDVLLDCGRLAPQAPGQQRVLAEVALAVLVVRPDASSVAQARWALERLSDLRGGRPVALVTMGNGPFRSHDIADVLEVELLAAIPRDDAAAALVCGEPGATRALTRSPVVTVARRIVAKLAVDGPAEEWRDAS